MQKTSVRFEMRAMQRIKGLKLLKSKFERPEGLKIEHVLGNSIGVWYNPDVELTEVVIELSGPTARIVQERFWHPSQTIKCLDDTGEHVEMRMQLSSLEELKSLILSWGRNAKVIAPIELKEAIKKEAASVLHRYRN